MARLAQLGPGVNSWTVLEMSPSILVQHLHTKELNAAWRELLAATDGLTIGIRSGALIRLDFDLHLTKPFLPSGDLTEITRPRLLRTGLSQISRIRVRKLEGHADQLSGSVVIPEEALDYALSVMFGNRAQSSLSR